MISLKDLHGKKKLLIIGAALLIVGAIYRFLPDAQEVFENDSIAQKQHKLNKYRSLLAEEQKLKAALSAAVRAANAAGQMLLQADTPAIAGVEIQNRVQQIADGQGVVVEAMRFLEPVKVEVPELQDYLAIPIQFSIDAPIEKMRSLLYDLESSGKLISVQEIRARAKNVGNVAEISATFIIWGYMKLNTENGSVERPA